MKTIGAIVSLVALLAVSCPADQFALSLFADESRFSQFAHTYPLDKNEIEAGFVPYSTDVVQGEPVIITFCVRNYGPDGIEIPTLNPRGNPDPTFSITATDQQGHEVAAAEKHNFGGIGSGASLMPTGVYFRTLFLYDYLTVPAPGRYTVTCVRKSRPFELHKLPNITTTLELTVRAADSDRLRIAIDQFGKVASTAPVNDIREAIRSDSDLVTATEALASLDDPQVVPHLLKSLRRGDGRNQRPAMEGLSKHPTESLVMAFQAPITDKRDSSVRSTAARALAAFKYPAAVTLLLSALDDKDKWVRRDVVTSLGQIGDQSVEPEVRKLLADNDAEVVLAAIDALVNLGVEPELAWYDPIFKSGEYTMASNNAVFRIANRWKKKSLPYLASKLRIDRPGMKNMLNYWLVMRISELSGEKFDYLHDFDHDGTEVDMDHNREVMRKICEKWIGPESK